MPSQESIEREIAARVVAGDEEAWRLVYDMCHDSLLHDASRRLGNLDDAEDAVQETFTRIFRYLSNFNPERDSLRAYLLAIVRNVCKDIYRRKMDRACRPWDDLVPEPAAPETDDPADREELARQRSIVDACCDPREREILSLVRKGLRNKEIAIALGMKETSVSSYICAIKEKASKAGSGSV